MSIEKDSAAINAMCGEIKLRYIQQVIATGNDLQRLFPAIKPLQTSEVCQEFILHVEQADWQNANRLSTSVAAVVRAARIRSAAAGEFATALEAYRQATNATLNILRVESSEANRAANRANQAAQADTFDETARRIEALVAQAVEQSSSDETAKQIEAAALDCLSPKQRKVVQCLLEQKHFVLADTIAEYPGAFREDVTSRAVQAAVARINDRWDINDIRWRIVSQDNGNEPRFKLEK